MPNYDFTEGSDDRIDNHKSIQNRMLTHGHILVCEKIKQEENLG